MKLKLILSVLAYITAFFLLVIAVFYPETLSTFTSNSKK